MSDVKMSKTKRRKKKGKRSLVPRAMTNGMIYKTSWSAGLLSTGTAGTVSTTIGFTIQNSSEYSSLTTLFSEVKLVSVNVVFSPRGTYSATNVGRIIVGYNGLYNSTTSTAPTGFLGVANCTHKVTISTNIIRPFIYRVPIARGLEYTLISADCPSAPTPWAGSPGVVSVWGDHMQASQDYFIVDVTNAVYYLKGRV